MNPKHIGTAARASTIRKPSADRHVRTDPNPLDMFSDTLDTSSSDEQSFDEEDMCGSDSDVETIPLPSGSMPEHQVQSSTETEVWTVTNVNRGSLMSLKHSNTTSESGAQGGTFNTGLERLSIMMETLCGAEGVCIASVEEGGSESDASAHDTCNMTSEVGSNVEENEG
jgi:hypothetical protein